MELNTLRNKYKIDSLFCYVPKRQTLEVVKDFISKEGEKTSACNYLSCLIRKYRKKIDVEKTIKILCFIFETINESKGKTHND